MGTQPRSQVTEKEVKMLSQVLLGLRQTTVCASRQVRRNIGVSAPVLAKAQQSLDPIQKLFHDKLMQYNEMSKKAGGKMVDVSPAREKALTDELAKIDRMFGGGSGVDMTAFPSFNFTDPQLEKVDLGLDPKEAEKETAAKKAQSQADTKEAKEDMSERP